MARPRQAKKSPQQSIAPSQDVYTATQELVCRFYDFEISMLQQARADQKGFEQFKARVGDKVFAEIVLLTGSNEKAEKFLAGLAKLNRRYDAGSFGDPKRRPAAWRYWREVKGLASRYALESSGTRNFFAKLALYTVPNVDVEGGARLAGLNWLKLAEAVSTRKAVPSKMPKKDEDFKD